MIKEYGYARAMSISRELKLTEDGLLRKYLFSELETYRTDEMYFIGSICGVTTTKFIGKLLELELEMAVDELKTGIIVYRNNLGKGTKIYYEE